MAISGEISSPSPNQTRADRPRQGATKAGTKENTIQKKKISMSTSPETDLARGLDPEFSSSSSSIMPPLPRP